MKFSRPNLPQGAACLCVVSGSNKQVIRALEQRGLTCYITRPSRALSAPVASHADMLAFSPRAGKLLLAADQRELHTRLQKSGVETVRFDGLKPGYPFETALNAAVVGKTLIGGETALSALKSFETNKLEALQVRQGYARCSIVPVTENALMTADKGIAAAARGAGLEVLELQPEPGIQLRGYQYGFLGGCCGKLSASQLAFCGDFTALSQHEVIRKFLSRFDVEPVSLISGPMQDIGGWLVIAEKE
ncbi:hypothetical protein H8S23_00410 [Anaerofilum sp. BX8]|uniref:DUF6873 domain-containing protein n=1 Tax=Anaerofilum hominis TaxID=2763016 RepID=A0A923I463_9FIRM|nr:hypothetical protein [Anaerofilum hominis]MBC5579963.1 hypothetical protein [Anaerofilum hominis]